MNTEVLIGFGVLLNTLLLVGLFAAVRRQRSAGFDEDTSAVENAVERTVKDEVETLRGRLREEFQANRSESMESARQLREEVVKLQKAGSEIVQITVKELGRQQQEAIAEVEKRVRSLADSNEGRLDKLREDYRRAVEGTAGV